MLELKNININLAYNDRTIIKNLNFTLNKNDKAAVIGEEGNGKSTLLKLIYDGKSIENYCYYSGDIIKKGSIGYLPQTIDAKYSDFTVCEYFSDIDTCYFTNCLIELGMPVEFVNSSQKIKTLSGGEKVKMQIAKILMERPDILLLDEPTNDIDIETLLWLENFMKNSKLPILFVSHDEMLIENVANTIIHIEQIMKKTECRITIAQTNYKDFINMRGLAINKQTQVAKKQRSDYNAQMERWTQIYNRVDHEQRVITRADPAGGRLLKKKMKSIKSQENRINRQAEDFLDIPSVEDCILVKFSDDIYIPSSKIIIDFELDKLNIEAKILSLNIILRVAGNEHIAIIGKNGVGKSTLLNEIWKTICERKDIIPYYMPQDYSQKLEYEKSPVEFLADNYTKDEITKARTYMGSMKFTHNEMTGKIANLSGGQKAKILFLDMVIKKANVLLLDEPTRNFSPLSSPVIRKTLADFKGTIISVSHDRKYLKEVCQKVYVLTGNGLNTNTD